VICSAGQPEEQPDPEKSLFLRAAVGFGTAKAVIASRNATVHVSTLLTLSQKLADGA
jgi:hypothetical protein